MVKLMIITGVLSLITATSGYANADQALNVFVSIAPQSYIVEQIGNPYVTVSTLVSPASDPHVYEPLPRQLVQLGSSDVFFSIGMPFENQLVEKIGKSQTKLLIKDMAHGIAKRSFTHAESTGCDHDHADHSHVSDKEALDPHVWLSPANIRQMAQNTMEVLSGLRPSLKANFQQNLDRIVRESQTIEQTLITAFKPFKGKSFYVFHPAFGYFADTVGLKQIPVEAEGKSPTPKRLAELIEQARRDNIRILFVQPQFDKSGAETVAKAIGGVVLPIDPLQKDVFANLRDISEQVLKVFK